MIKNVPKYISSFDLEEARLGQAIQATKTLLKQEVLKKILIFIRDESINAEFAIKEVMNDQKLQTDQFSLSQLEIVLKKLISKKINNE